MYSLPRRFGLGLPGKRPGPLNEASSGTGLLEGRHGLGQALGQADAGLPAQLLLGQGAVQDTPALLSRLAEAVHRPQGGAQEFLELQVNGEDIGFPAGADVEGPGLG